MSRYRFGVVLAAVLIAVLAAWGLVGCGGAKQVSPPAIAPGGTPPPGPSAARPGDPYLRSEGHWVIDSAGKGPLHLIGELVSDSKAASGVAWSTASSGRKPGWLVYGPYYKGLPPGKYRADFYLNISGAKNAKDVVIDVHVLNNAAGVAVNRSFATKDVGEDTGGEYRAFPLDFEVPFDLGGAGFEFRVLVTSATPSVRSDRVEITKQ